MDEQEKRLTESPGAKRIIEHSKKHPPKKGGLKAEEMEAHAERMGMFMQACKKKRGIYSKAAFKDADQLTEAIDEYVATVIELKMFPTWGGLALYCDITPETLYALERLGDERSDVLQKYRLYISEFFNQSGLSSSTNPIFSIYYGRSVLGQSDQTAVDVNVNINGGAQSTFSSEKIEEIIDLTPDDYSE